MLSRAFNSVGDFVTDSHSLCGRSDKRPDGFAQIPWWRGRCLAWDAICPNTSAQSYNADLRSYRRISSRLSRGEEATEERRFEQWDRLRGIYADIYQNLFV